MDVFSHKKAVAFLSAVFFFRQTLGVFDVLKTDSSKFRPQKTKTPSQPDVVFVQNLLSILDTEVTEEEPQPGIKLPQRRPKIPIKQKTRRRKMQKHMPRWDEDLVIMGRIEEFELLVGDTTSLRDKLQDYPEWRQNKTEWMIAPTAKQSDMADPDQESKAQFQLLRQFMDENINEVERRKAEIGNSDMIEQKRRRRTTFSSDSFGTTASSPGIAAVTSGGSVEGCEKKKIDGGEIAHTIAWLDTKGWEIIRNTKDDDAKEDDTYGQQGWSGGSDFLIELLQFRLEDEDALQGASVAYYVAAQKKNEPILDCGKELRHRLQHAYTTALEAKRIRLEKQTSIIVESEHLSETIKTVTQSAEQRWQVRYGNPESPAPVMKVLRQLQTVTFNLALLLVTILHDLRVKKFIDIIYNEAEAKNPVTQEEIRKAFIGPGTFTEDKVPQFAQTWEHNIPSSWAIGIDGVHKKDYREFGEWIFRFVIEKTWGELKRFVSMNTTHATLPPQEAPGSILGMVALISDSEESKKKMPFRPRKE